MNNELNPPRSFIIESLTLKGEHLCYWRLDQRSPGRGNPTDDIRLRKQVRRHLDDLQCRTGCTHKVRCWGSPEFCDSYLEEKLIEVH